MKGAKSLTFLSLIVMFISAALSCLLIIFRYFEWCIILSLLETTLSFVIFIVLAVNRKTSMDKELSLLINNIGFSFLNRIQMIRKKLSDEDPRWEIKDLNKRLQAVSEKINTKKTALDAISIMHEVHELLWELIEKFREEYESGISSMAVFKKNLLIRNYTRDMLIPILNDLTVKLNDFSKKIIMDLISRFSDISKNNKLITGGIEKSMLELMEDDKTDNLAHIIKESGRLTAEFDVFYNSMERLKNKWDEFTSKTAGMLKNIGEIINSIQQVSDTIKLISLNFSIQAVSAGNSSKSFQVLARDLRAFTLKTIKFSAEVKDRVKYNQALTSKLTDNYVKDMKNVYDSLNSIKISFESFGSILNSAVKHIKISIQNLNNFSAQIEADMKNVIGKLQFYDITSQGTSHLKSMFEFAFQDNEIAQEDAASPVETLSQEEKNTIRKHILEAMNRLITSEQERIVLEKYEKEFNIQVHENAVIENKAEKDLAVGGESVIIF